MQPLSPLFLNEQISNESPTSDLESSPRGGEQNPIAEPDIDQDQNRSTDRPANNNSDSSKRAVRFKPASSIFAQTSTSSNTEDKPKETDKNETSRGTDTEPSSQPSRKKIAHSTSLSALFGGDAKKERSDKGK